MSGKDPFLGELGPNMLPLELGGFTEVKVLSGTLLHLSEIVKDHSRFLG